MPVEELSLGLNVDHAGGVRVVLVPVGQGVQIPAVEETAAAELTWSTSTCPGFCMTRASRTITAVGFNGKVCLDLKLKDVTVGLSAGIPVDGPGIPEPRLLVQRAGILPETMIITQGRSDQGSSPCSRQRQSPSRMSPWSRRMHRPRRWPEAGSSNRRQDPHACRST
jgi:hypothetical protein